MREGRLEDVHQSIPHNRVCSRFLFDFIRAGEFGKKKKKTSLHSAKETQ